MSYPESLLPFTELPLNRQVIHMALKQYKRPYDKISELLRKEYLVAVKNGLYVPGPKANLPGPEPFTLSNHLYGPSYVSLDSALSWWGFIPEQVFGVTAITSRNSRNFTTPYGLYSYLHLPFPYYSFGITSLVLSSKQKVLIATPEKAICDKLICTSGILFRSKKEAYTILTEDLRIDADALKKLNTTTLSSWIADSPKKQTLELLITTIESL